MPRKPRVDYPGAWHHVFNRGIGHGVIFETDHSRAFFLRCLDDACMISGVEVHAYCLMGNHFHLLLHSRTGRLGVAMQSLSRHYTQGTNQHLGRDGPLFRGRFQSVPVVTDAQLLSVSRYIHRNPVQAGLAAQAADWPWSSAQAYLGGPKPQWLHMATTLALFDGPRAARDQYREFLQDGEHEVGSDPLSMGSDPT